MAVRTKSCLLRFECCKTDQMLWVLMLGRSIHFFERPLSLKVVRAFSFCVVLRSSQTLLRSTESGNNSVSGVLYGLLREEHFFNVGSNVV